MFGVKDDIQKSRKMIIEIERDVWYSIRRKYEEE